MADTRVDGYCDPAFASVRDVFAEHLASGADVGAAVAVQLDGRPVVDLWGGMADQRAERAWERDTRCVTFSCTKAVTAAAVLLLAERGAVELGGRVVDWWPEFGVQGKDATTTEHLLSHQEGLPAFDRAVSVEEAADSKAMATQLASQAPEWAAGTAHGYHALTFGWLLGELVRRIDGRSVGEFVRAEIDPELWIGVAPEQLGQLARVIGGRPMHVDELPAPADQVARLIEAVGDPDSPMQRSTANPAASFNNPTLLTAGWPAAGLVTTARDFAAFYARLVGGAILAPATLREAIRERVRGADRTLVLESAFGLGFMRPSPNMYLPPAARASAFGHPGASGALGLGDVDCALGFAYIPNVSRPALGDRRAYRLVEEVYACL
jgi:CubicO group peptidase (beta-lactamase class C family)